MSSNPLNTRFHQQDYATGYGGYSVGGSVPVYAYGQPTAITYDRPTTNHKAFLVVTGLIAFIAITFLVLGILGTTGHIPMAPAGAWIMSCLGICGVMTILEVIIEKFCCKANGRY